MTGLWRLFALGGVAATAVYLLDLSPAVDGVCALLIGGGTVAACTLGPRRLAAEPRHAWPLIGAASFAFLVGVILRPIVTAAGLPLIADAFTIPGYLLLCAFLILLLRARQSLEWHSVLDGLIVCLSGGLASTMLLALPAADITGRPAVVSMLAGLYPLFDVVVLMLVLGLTFTARTWPISLIAMLACMAMLLTGDLAYAIIGARGELYSSPLLDAPFLVAYLLLGITALHPSAVLLGRPSRPPVPAWSGRRMALLIPARTRWSWRSAAPRATGW
jgi:hypothetical protein